MCRGGKLVEGTQGQPTHLACPDDQDDLVVEAGEDAAEVFDRHAGDGGVAVGDAGFCADALGGLAGVLE
jgi:hypothetical protein